ncbi:hypothetical protein GCM10010129_57350 [Streptomyces fumigatiscleroticus]|nr:hypothetical protein GCM10010129_57350 [Streptomyces fumigatiscleroticus]
MPLTAAMTGTRSTGHHEIIWYGDLFATYLGPWTTPDARFCIGGAKGVDSPSLWWLAKKSTSSLVIVVPGTVEQQPAEARQAITRCRDRIAEVVELRAARACWESAGHSHSLRTATSTVAS